MGHGNNGLGIDDDFQRHDLSAGTLTIERTGLAFGLLGWMGRAGLRERVDIYLRTQGHLNLPAAD